MMELFWPYLSLAFSAFISATLLPFGSELVLVGLLTQGYPVLVLWGIATVFNTLGSVLNWYLGRQLLLFQHKSWFMFKPQQIEQASGQFQRGGTSAWAADLHRQPSGGHAGEASGRHPIAADHPQVAPDRCRTDLF